jgi:hypothetical protein
LGLTEFQFCTCAKRDQGCGSGTGAGKLPGCCPGDECVGGVRELILTFSSADFRSQTCRAKETGTVRLGSAFCSGLIWFQFSLGVVLRLSQMGLGGTICHSLRGILM